MFDGRLQGDPLRDLIQSASWSRPSLALNKFQIMAPIIFSASTDLIVIRK